MNLKASLKNFMQNMNPIFHVVTEHDVLLLPMTEISDDAALVSASSSSFPNKDITGFITSKDGLNIIEVKAHGMDKPSPPGSCWLTIDLTDLKRINSRLYPRFQFTPPLNGLASVEDDGRSTPVKIVDLSAGGLCCETEADLPTERPIVFNFQLDLAGELHDIRVSGTVLDKKAAPGSSVYKVKFSKPGYDRADFDAPAARETAKRTIYLMTLVNRLIKIRKTS